MARTYNEIYLDMRRRLRDGGIEDPSLEARRLLALASGYTDTELIARFFLFAGEDTEKKVRQLIYRRLEGEPLAYIAGGWEFYGLPFLVDRNVLIPRIDTEVLVFTALELMKDVPDPRILDLCCGSGCIGCTLAKKLPTARTIFADISPEALTVARKNVSLHRLAQRSVCMNADALSPPPLRMENFDLLCCNPPYITTAEMEKLDPSVKDWEPAMALDGGEDGLVFYRGVIGNWKSVLKDDGILIFEVGEGQAEPVRALMTEHGFYNLGCALDTIGVERVVYGRKRKETDSEQ